MKFIMNGGLILGTWDGANIEIAQECGAENMFIFGATSDQIPLLRHQLAYGSCTMKGCEELEMVLETLRKETISTFGVIDPILNSLRPCNDYYLITQDFESYLKAQDEVDECYRDKKRWTDKSIAMVAGSGFFSTDRTIKEYASKIWSVESTPRKEYQGESYDELCPV